MKNTKNRSDPMKRIRQDRESNETNLDHPAGVGGGDPLPEAETVLPDAPASGLILSVDRERCDALDAYCWRVNDGLQDGRSVSQGIRQERKHLPKRWRLSESRLRVLYYRWLQAEGDPRVFVRAYHSHTPRKVNESWLQSLLCQAAKLGSIAAAYERQKARSVASYSAFCRALSPGQKSRIRTRTMVCSNACRFIGSAKRFSGRTGARESPPIRQLLMAR